MTFAIGGAGYEAYQRAYDALIKIDYKQTFRFDAFLFGKWMHLLLFADSFRFQVDTALKNIYFEAFRSSLYRLSMQIAPKGAVMRMDKTATVNTVCPQANPIASVIERLRIGWEDVPGRLGAQREKI